ncbi:Retrovirus-related Pol polyprotein from transposon 17.6 [Araneus ventricosus]|uniref:Retrovirus-related Pol polyprotein from transposon 17.6 n=1 Tax=Araneus ventricosus TaxID=182803 RepID=A0A4Y2J9T6_ARAVE|nr:Retrovirus-related Pol polyprotein from transposon 17.6 [Araneus ventricosus]
MTADKLTDLTTIEKALESRHLVMEDDIGRVRDDKFESPLNVLEKLVNSSVAGKKNTPRRNPNATCWSCKKRGAYRESNGVLVAAILVDLKRKAIPVRVLNLKNKPKIVTNELLLRRVNQWWISSLVLKNFLKLNIFRLFWRILKYLMKNSEQQKLNEITKKDSYPLPRIDDTLDALNGSQWFTTLDLKSGYWQVEIRPEDREKTAFTTGQGLWQFKVMSFGLCNAPDTFERLMETALHGLSSEACLVYLDYIIIVGRTFDDLNNLRKVFQRLQKANLKLSPKKCRFFQKEVVYLGHVIPAEGVQTDPENIKAIVDWPLPDTVHFL